MTDDLQELIDLWNDHADNLGPTGRSRLILLLLAEVGDLSRRLAELSDPELPPEWATVDRCLDWLRERDALVYFAPNQPASRGGSWVKYVGPSGKWEFSHAGDFRVALIAACRAVQKAS